MLSKRCFTIVQHDNPFLKQADKVKYLFLNRMFKSRNDSQRLSCLAGFPMTNYSLKLFYYNDLFMQDLPPSFKPDKIGTFFQIFPVE
jgi:hypothetical protein